MRVIIWIAVAVMAAFAIYLVTSDGTQDAPPAVDSTAPASLTAGPSIGLIDDNRINNADSEPGNFQFYQQRDQYPCKYLRIFHGQTIFVCVLL